VEDVAKFDCRNHGRSDPPREKLEVVQSKAVVESTQLSLVVNTAHSHVAVVVVAEGELMHTNCMAMQDIVAAGRVRAPQRNENSFQCVCVTMEVPHHTVRCPLLSSESRWT
jgi:hypothetical protein